MRANHFDEKLRNWGEWMRKGKEGGLGFRDSQLAGLLGQSARAEAGCVIPIDDVEASRIDDAVRAQPVELQRVAMAWYVEGLSIRQSAKRLSCSTTTVPLRVDALCRGVEIWWAKRQPSKLEKNHFVN